MARRGAVFRYPADFFGAAAPGADTAADGVATKDLQRRTLLGRPRIVTERLAGRREKKVEFYEICSYLLTDRSREKEELTL